MFLKYSIDKLLYRKGKEDCFIHQITPDAETREEMHKIKMLVRKTIRNAFQEINTMIEHKDYVALSHRLDAELDRFITDPLKKESALADLKKIKPKFSSQGSSVYGTLNTPCQAPQQMDVDDGAYLPMTFFEKGGPIIAKEAFFKIVDTALEDLCKKHHWRFVGNKNTCARIIVNKDIHIDIPLYAIPDTEYAEFSDSAKASLSYKQEEPQMIMLDANQVYLAIRNEEHWKASDPREVSEWFQSEVKLHGKRLRRVCRYLKAWRDQTWPNGGPSSIALMACAVDTFNNLNFADGFDSDTVALLSVTNNLGLQLKVGIELPVNGEILYPRKHDQGTISDVVIAAKSFNSKLDNALSKAINKDQCLANVIDIFGTRIPPLVEHVDPISSRIRQTAPQIQSSSPVNEIEPNFKAG